METDTAAADLYPTPPRKQTGALLDLWSASPAGWPLLPLNQERENISSSPFFKLLAGMADFFLSPLLLSVWHLPTVS